MTQRRSLFILPGLLGEDWRIHEFAEAVAGHFTPVFLSHEDGDGAHGLAWVARRAADRIVAGQGEGDVAILGYSYGANVAYEAVRLLQARGRTVSFFGVIDPALPDTEFDFFRDMPARSIAHWGPRKEWLLFLLRRKLVWFIASRLPYRKYRRRILLRMHLYGRLSARREWAPHPLHVPGLIVTSAQLRGVTEDRLKELCPAMRAMTVDTRHSRVFGGPSGRSIARAVIDHDVGEPRRAAATARPAGR